MAAGSAAIVRCTSKRSLVISPYFHRLQMEHLAPVVKVRLTRAGHVDLASRRSLRKTSAGDCRGKWGASAEDGDVQRRRGLHSLVASRG
jgi:hypothetical protein